ncbi:MAG: hypothetical protein VW982_06915 [Candidatus Poseidoniales archaeon]|jgi:Tfp pilus assembly protein PilO
MFDTWTLGTWLILVVDIIAIIIVVMFLKRKIQHKLDEVEARQAHERLMRKQTRTPSAEESSK